MLVFGWLTGSGVPAAFVLPHEESDGSQKVTVNSQRQLGRQSLVGTVLLFYLACAASLFAQPAPSGSASNEIRIVALYGTVEVSPAGAKTWVLTQTNQVLHSFDRVRTGSDGFVVLHWGEESKVPFGASTELEVLPPDGPDADAGLHLVRGVFSFFHRDKPGRIRVMTRGATAGIEGTEFVMSVDGSDRTTLSVIDGKVRFGNEQATLLLTNNEQAVAEIGTAPRRTPGFIANNILQWCFYYPAVLDPADLTFNSDEQHDLSQSLDAYRSGDLLAAQARYPTNRVSVSDAERVYHAALLLSAGGVDEAQTILDGISSAESSERSRRLAGALRELIAAVKRQTVSARAPEFATDLLANSYYEQSQAKRDESLTLALSYARRAATNSPQFGFAWERVAEMEFSFGNTKAAREALEKSLALAPRNAQALALKGFLLAADGKTREAVSWFDRALAIDSALGNAWLGRGLCRIHLGDGKGGLDDLSTAAALEPQRAELRSYLGKGYGDFGDFAHATNELLRAKTLDPHDPTAWLYSALLNQQYNRINESIRDLEHSEQLNDNRSVYRSQMLLDQDAAVRSANLAGVYADAGMDEVAQREASRAVNYDYGNYSAHLFLANSYEQLSDPNLVNLRYETPAESEFLLANLLAPVNAGPLSAAISQQEYSRLFTQNGLGIYSSTEYLSRGAWSESGGQYGIYDNFNYNFMGSYRSDPGQQFNNDIQEQEFSFNFKARLSPQDSAFLLVQYFKDSGGDLSELYNPKLATNSTFRFDERQEPIVGIGYHHEWAPGVETLVFGARLVDNASFTNSSQPTLIFFEHANLSPPPQTVLSSVQGFTAAEQFEGQIEVYSGEVQQIFEEPAHSTILGARVQYGDFKTQTLQDTPSSFGGAFFDTTLPLADQNISSVFKRFSVYGYHEWEVSDWLELIGGVAYDRITFPENFRSAPISNQEETRDQVSPKAGFILRPANGTTFRFAYTRSLSGASIDQGYLLEPSQVAGFIQSFRSIIPESVVGANAGAQFETYGLSLEQKLPTETYLGLSGEILNSTVNRSDGAFDVDFPNTTASLSSLREHLDYTEQTVMFTVNQLVGNEWSLGSRYSLSRAILNDDFPGVGNNLIFGTPPSFSPRQRTEGILNNVDLFALYNNPCGFVAEGEAVWYGQHNIGFAGTEPGDDFWQFNISAGYRFPRRRAEVMLGLLNVTGQNYKLNPLNIYNELPRERTLAVRFNLNF